MTRAKLQLSAAGLRASFSDSHSGKYKLRIGGTMPGGPVGFLHGLRSSRRVRLAHTGSRTKTITSYKWV